MGIIEVFKLIVQFATLLQGLYKAGKITKEQIEYWFKRIENAENIDEAFNSTPEDAANQLNDIFNKLH